MSGYIDRTLIHNSALACFLLASFTKEYQVRTVNRGHPSFEKLLLVLPLVWHGPSRRGIQSRNFATPMHVVIADEPRITESLADRVAAHAAVSSQGLNIACATGLLVKRFDGDEREFAFGPPRWPPGSSPASSIDNEMSGTVLRLANWFKDFTAAELFAILGLH
ncbi:three component ABC system middle component [Burkholderia ubonensis]|uniref:three component ABC system middle component n=1 Tax=Burkholderia ubonensis TaxID=101571 RepID=UPI0012F80BD1|nr:three component ABC system middle component [Burkholderia ubonensis]